MGRSREEKEKQARKSLLRYQNRARKLAQEIEDLTQLRRKRQGELKKVHQKRIEAKAQLILTLPSGAKVHYGSYPCSTWAWIGERTGTIVKTGTKRVLIDYGDRGKVWVYAYELDEGEGNRDEAQAKVAAEIGQVLGG